MADQSDHTALEQLIELFVYAPVGMIYEYPEVLPKLIRRGKSQVQLAKVLGQMAAKQGTGSVDSSVTSVLGSAAVAFARGITEFGSMVGLAPHAATATPAATTPAHPRPTQPASTPGAATPTTPSSSVDRIPIDNYDQLTAKAVVACLDDLTPSQRARIGAHEMSNKNRKTVLAKLERLADG